MACCSRGQGIAGRQTVFGGARPVTLDYPELFDGRQLYPLLLLLHGRGMTAEQGRNTLGCQTAHQFGDGMLVLAPQGLIDISSPTASFWNGTDACCDFYASGVDDVAYLLGLIEEVIAAGWPVDTTRIGVMGYSNGGFMAHTLSRCSNKAGGIGRITWGCAVNGMGPLPGDSQLCTTVRPVHWVQANGTLDVTVAYAGDTTGTDYTGDAPVGPYPGALASAAQWASLNGVSGTLQPSIGSFDFIQTVAGAESTVQLYDGAPANGSVTVVTLVGEDHVISTQTGPTPTSWTNWVLDQFVSHPRI